MAGTIASDTATVSRRPYFAAARRPIEVLLQSRMCRVALIVALIITVALWVIYALTGDWVGQDLNVYRVGGSTVLHGHRLYDSTFVTPTDLAFTYPPFAALLFVPLALIPEQAAVALWTLAIVVAAGALVAVSLIAAGHKPLSRRWQPYVILGGGMLATWLSPIQDCMYEGQVGAFLALLCVADVALPETRWRRGILVGVATALKMTPGLFIVYFAATRNWKAMRTAAITTLACWAASAVVLPQDSFTYFVKGAGYDSRRVGDVSDHLNESLNGFWHRLPVPAPTVWWLMSAALVAALGLWRARSAAKLGDQLGAAVLVGMTSVLLAPISWLHHAVWVVPAIIRLCCRQERRLVSIVAATAMALILSIPYGRLVGIGVHERGPLVEVYVAIFIAIVAFLPIGARRHCGDEDVNRPGEDPICSIQLQRAGTVP